ncbi:DUF2690 domain-containing protein [Micromonospora eburnea]|uniref:DUF2690 domain-containing protein n=1 Tax=Micromonospora eburnea TaxID=227316 RepID=A0A1C6VH68_9ACTN|nr:DUF2690 domain-containing protein [Micromonospora eburnea]SCL65547.1 Protein of unknown function [Micromonospora eburnea]
MASPILERLDENMRVLSKLRVWRVAAVTSRRRLARVAAGLAAAVVAGMMAVPSPASAATVGCGSACDNKDPQTYVAMVDQAGYCYMDAKTVSTASYVELRYSPWCRTAWGRQTGSYGYLSGVLVRSYRTDGSLRATYDSQTSDGAWSRMANDKGLLAQACFYQYDSELDFMNDKKHVLYCTGKY